MFSLENFYYILYTNLFKPARTRLKYFLPFGSTAPQHLIEFELDVKWPEQKHTMIFFDQEPVLKEFIDELDKFDKFSKGIKNAQIFVHSDISETTNQVCKKYEFINLYYFFHGFASLIWFNDYKYLSYNYKFTKKYICLNHIVTNDRSYRLTLIRSLIEKNILCQGIVSANTHPPGKNLIHHEVNSLDSKLSNDAKSLIKTYMWDIEKSLIADKHSVSGTLSAAAGPEEHMLNQSAFLHVVTETVFYYEKLHLTEKIFRPIVSKRPFILVGAPENLKYLKKYGFKTFDKWINEDYDLEHNHDRRLKMISDEIEKICNLSMDQLRTMQLEMEEILEFNYTHFYTTFKDIIITELLDNFKSSVRIWNSSRVDGRIIDLSNIDFIKVKNLLLN